MRAVPADRAPHRLGIVGCGRVVERLHWPALRSSQEWRIAAAADPLSVRRSWIGSVLPHVPTFETLSELLAKSEVDAVLLATPPATHCALSIDALSSGVAVLVEKPMALSVNDARAMRDAAHQARRPLWVGFNRRFRSSYRALRDRIGVHPREARCDISFLMCLGGGTWSAVSGFQGAETEGGGVLDDVASHQLDLLPWLLSDRRQQVHARQLERSAIPTYVIAMTFENGATATCIAAHGPRFREHLTMRLGNRQLVADSAGAWNASHLPTPLAGWIADRRAVAQSAWRKLGRRPSGTIESIHRQWQEFAQAVAGSDQPHDGADAEAGLRCVEAVADCRASLGMSAT